MNEDAARAVLLVKAIEESDGAGEVLPHADRRWATREAGADLRLGGDTALSPDESDFLAKRARLLLPVAARRAPVLHGAHEAVAWRSSLALGLGIAAFALGLALDQAQPGREINIVAFPLLGMLAWNMVVYGVLIAAGVRRPRQPARADRGPVVHALRSILTRSPRSRLDASAPQAPASSAIAGFLSQWNTLAAPLYAARTQRLLHACAALVAAGAIAGLYLRGVAFEYRAGWESTFLDAGAVRVLLAAVLAPASALTGIAVPDESHIAALRWSAGAGENAARWIHLYAATAMLLVVVPRAALALWTGCREARLRTHFPLPPDIRRYGRSLLAARHDHERAATAVLLPYNCTLSEAARRAIESALSGLSGSRVESRVLPTVRYGEEESASAAARHEDAPAQFRAVVFNMSATPEEENQGLVLHAWRAALPAGSTVLAMLDEGAYRRRMGAQAGGESRVAERRAAWERFAREHGVETLAFDSQEEPAASRTR